MSKKYSHPDLCKIGVSFLYNRLRCKVVVSEFRTGNVLEIPDVIGWDSRGISFLIECKTSKADFFADSKKTSRRANMKSRSLGQRRYFLAPKGLIEKEEIPKGWGFLEVDGRGVTVTKEPFRGSINPAISKTELPLLISMLYRASVEGFQVGKSWKEIFENFLES